MIEQGFHADINARQCLAPAESMYTQYDWDWSFLARKINLAHAPLRLLSLFDAVCSSISSSTMAKDTGTKRGRRSLNHSNHATFLIL